MTTSDPVQMHLAEQRNGRSPVGRAVVTAALLTMVGTPALAADGQEIAPAPAAIGADVPATYFGPAPSSVQRELVGPFQNLRAERLISIRERSCCRSTKAP